jgi:hypothetical protein
MLAKEKTMRKRFLFCSLVLLAGSLVGASGETVAKPGESSLLNEEANRLLQEIVQELKNRK